MEKNIRSRLFIATVCGEHSRIIDEYGIGVELDQFCQAEKMDEPLAKATCLEIDGLLAKARKCILHAPFSELFPAAIDPRARLLAMERLQQAAGYVVEYGAEKMVVHSGYVPLIFHKEWHEDRSVEFWQEMMADRSDGLHIVIENVIDDEPYMMAGMMERIKIPDIRLCLDVGHASCVGSVQPREWLEVLAPYIGHIHLHNNDGTYDYHGPVFDGKTDMGIFWKGL